MIASYMFKRIITDRKILFALLGLGIALIVIGLVIVFRGLP